MDADVRGPAEVELAVGVEVAHGHGLQIRTEADAAGELEGAVAVAPQDAHIIVPGRHHVEVAVRVEVGDREGNRRGAGAGTQRRPEGAVALAEEYAQGSVGPDRKVQKAVVVEVGSGDRLGIRTGGVVDRGKEARQVAVLQRLDSRPVRGRAPTPVAARGGWAAGVEQVMALHGLSPYTGRRQKGLDRLPGGGEGPPGSEPRETVHSRRRFLTWLPPSSWLRVPAAKHGVRTASTTRGCSGRAWRRGS